MIRIIKISLVGIILLQGWSISAQSNLDYKDTVEPRIRVMIDNDFGGDPDGLFQLAHHILSPSVEIKGIIGSINYQGGFYGSPSTATYACMQVNELLRVMQLTGKFPVYEGGNFGLTDIKTPIVSEGAKAIVREAMREDTQTPLYVVCGAGLTSVASAYLMEPRIAKKIILVWIGGGEYQGLTTTPRVENNPEYNLGIDIKACQVIFNISDIPIWQVPRDTYRQALYSYSELVYKIKPNGIVGKFLVEKLEYLMKKAKGSLGEAYVLGDSPLVLLTALQASWNADPSSSKYVIKSTPKVNNSGLYEETTQNRPIRVYIRLDTRLMFDDLVAKLALLKLKN
ncbi:nucleoside hydrolase [Flavobacterium sp. UBA6031]|uniref:nucleoside hydrolase n=1 Tax=Flavobacterium sp. UBA6031 TaxID=1946551 RepID=UPI0025C50CF8|nr:nucleoside hydrolase [Flavobacterium sp. UBA6031]